MNLKQNIENVFSQFEEVCMVYYVAFYNPQQEVGRRVANYAGEDKIDYICEALNQIGESVTILSNTKSTQNVYLKKTVYNESKLKTIIMFATFPKKNVVLHILDVLYGYLQLIFFLLLRVKNKDIVLVYHSLGYRNILHTVRKLRKFKYILEVEELFQYIEQAKSSFKDKESVVFHEPDGFIFSNDILKEKINVKGKPAVVINGIYKNQDIIYRKKPTDKKRVVYAGSLEPQKGVDYVINAAKLLSDEYEMKIIGFGSKIDIERVYSLINKVNETSKCHVIYEGIFKGEKYLQYIQSCDIGVCIQNPKDLFNLYEFPSKIFSYMSNGLNVVVNRLEQIEKSSVIEYLTIAEGTDPSSIARAISTAAQKEVKPHEVLSKLNASFKEELQILIRGE